MLTMTSIGHLFQTVYSSARLPRLPVPALRPTMLRYLRSIEPLLVTADLRQSMPWTTSRFTASPAEPVFERTQEAVERLLSSPEAARCQRALEEKAMELVGTSSSWLLQWWLERAYLGFRESLVANSNYYFTLPATIPAERFSHLAELVTRCFVFRDRIMSGTAESLLQPSKSGVPPEQQCLQMFQYMFHTTRIPQAVQDRISVEDWFLPANRFVVVSCRGRFFKVLLQQGASATAGLTESFSQIWHSCLARSDDSPEQRLWPGILTAMHRDLWAERYSTLVSIPSNRPFFDAIAKAAFVVCLDDFSPASDVEFERELLLGERGYPNRWFDKCFQLISFPNGRIGMHFDHTGMDGTVAMRLVDYLWLQNGRDGTAESTGGSQAPIQGDSSEILPVVPAEAGPIGSAARPALGMAVPSAISLPFTFDAETARRIASMESYHLSRNAGGHIDFDTLKIEFGKDLIKTQFGSPDAFLQSVFLRAFFKVWGYVPPTYESCSTRRFSGGRTETVRSATVEMSDFVASTEAFCGSRALWKRAMDAHVAAVRLAGQGQGIDRHLLGLRLIREEIGVTDASMDEFFADPMYQYSSSHWTMSTSNISHEKAVAGFGPVVPDGYGVCYNIRDSSVEVRLSGALLRTAPLKLALEDAAQELLRNVSA